MKRFFSTGVLFILLNIGFGQENLKFHTYKSFQPGENLKYVIYYGPINGGIAIMNLKKAKFNGNPALYSKMIAKSTGITDKIFNVEDIYECFFDEETVLPYKSVRDISEGKYTKYDEVVYNHKDNTIRSELSGIQKMPEDIRDMVAAFFYLRKIDYSSLKDGDIIKINTFFDDELFPFDIRYKGKEVVNTKLGEFKCLKLVPFVEPGRIFKSEDDMTIWISDDRNLVPIRVKFNLLVGALKIDLIEYSGLPN